MIGVNAHLIITRAQASQMHGTVQPHTALHWQRKLAQRSHTGTSTRTGTAHESDTVRGDMRFSFVPTGDIDRRLLG